MSSSRRVVWTVHGPAAPRLDRADVSSMGSRRNPSKPCSAAAARWETSAVEPEVEHPGHQLLLPRRRRAANREGARPQPLEPAAPDPGGELVARSARRRGAARG